MNGRDDKHEIRRLIQFLENAAVTEFDFTIIGRQQVCKPKYLLTTHRDLIVRLLKAEIGDAGHQRRMRHENIRRLS